MVAILNSFFMSSIFFYWISFQKTNTLIVHDSLLIFSCWMLFIRMNHPLYTWVSKQSICMHVCTAYAMASSPLLSTKQAIINYTESTFLVWRLLPLGLYDVEYTLKAEVLVHLRQKFWSIYVHNIMCLPNGHTLHCRQFH